MSERARESAREREAAEIRGTVCRLLSNSKSTEGLLHISFYFCQLVSTTLRRQHLAPSLACFDPSLSDVRIRYRSLRPSAFVCANPAFLRPTCRIRGWKWKGLTADWILIPYIHGEFLSVSFIRFLGVFGEKLLILTGTPKIPP